MLKAGSSTFFFWKKNVRNTTKKDYTNIVCKSLDCIMISGKKDSHNPNIIQDTEKDWNRK